jgi:molybdopterin-containing oxidoreductase family iron-sulfur binding subunit
MNRNERSAISDQREEQRSAIGVQRSEEHSTAFAGVPEAQENLVQIEARKPTLADVRAKLANQKGKKFWRSVDELAETPEFAEMVAKEFPSQASEWIDPVSRRNFLKVMGASMALAGLAGCTKQPDEAIMPYVTAPEDLILGKPVYFASAFPFASGAVPVLVKSDSYRPIKVDGNPEHPVVRGGSDPFTQATLLDLYDPDRSQHILYRGETRTWPSFLAAFRSMLAD